MQFLPQRICLGIAHSLLQVSLKNGSAKKCKICLIMFTFIHIFGLNFLVEIRSAVFLDADDLNLSFICSIRVNAFSCDALIKVLCAQPRFRPLIMKQMIYANRCLKQQGNIKQLKEKIEFTRKSELYNVKQNNKCHMYYRKWFDNVTQRERDLVQENFYDITIYENMYA